MPAAVTVSGALLGYGKAVIDSLSRFDSCREQEPSFPPDGSVLGCPAERFETPPPDAVIRDFLKECYCLRPFSLDSFASRECYYNARPAMEICDQRCLSVLHTNNLF